MTLAQRYLIQLKKQKNPLWEGPIKIGLMLFVAGLFLFPVFVPVAAFASILPAFLGAWLALGTTATLLVNPIVSLFTQVSQFLTGKYLMNKEKAIVKETLQYAFDLLNSEYKSSKGCSAEMALQQDNVEDEIKALQNQLKKVKNREEIAFVFMQVRNLLGRIIQDIPVIVVENKVVLEKLKSFRHLIPDYDAFEDIQELFSQRPHFFSNPLAGLSDFKPQDLVSDAKPPVLPSPSCDSLPELIPLNDNDSDEDCDDEHVPPAVRLGV